MSDQYLIHKFCLYIFTRVIFNFYSFNLLNDFFNGFSAFKFL